MPAASGKDNPLDKANTNRGRENTRSLFQL